MNRFKITLLVFSLITTNTALALYKPDGSSISQSLLGPPSALTNPVEIRKLAENAYVWGLPLEFTYRFNRYNELVSAPTNELAYVPNVAMWNNASTNAGSASTLYLNGGLDLSGNNALVYTIPKMDGIFTISQIIDAFTNVVSDPGTRTIDTSIQHSFLVVGPDSEYAKETRATINGYDFEVISVDTNHAEVLGRVLAQTLLPPESKGSVNDALNTYAHNITLNTLSEFQANGNRPVPPTAYLYPPSDDEAKEAVKWQDTPADAIEFFEQMGESVKINKLPNRSTGFSGLPIRDLPKYMVAQAHALTKYYPPSSGQARKLSQFAPIGLTSSGFKIPSNWKEKQISAFYRGFNDGVTKVADLIKNPPNAKTNYWKYLNDNFGLYANNRSGYQYRAIGVVAGGFPNIPIDGFYAKQDLYKDGSPLDGNKTYSITFMPSSLTPGLPANSILPPLSKDGSGNALGYWSLSIYQRGLGVAACPCISQASQLNKHYTNNVGNVTANPATNTIQAEAPYPGAYIDVSTGILFGDNAADYGLQANKTYYVASKPVHSTINGKDNYLFTISDKWIQDLSQGDPSTMDVGTPIQNTGVKGDLIDIKAGSKPLKFSIIQPVVQLGSEEIKSNQLAQNADGSYTIWIAPRLPKGAAPSNWIPTPSTEYLQSIYGTSKVLNTTIQPIMRIYAAQPGNQPPSILPCKGTACTPHMSKATGYASYLFPLIQEVPQ